MKKSIPFFFLFLCHFLFAQYSDPQYLYSNFLYGLTDIESGDLDNDGLDDLVFAFDWHISWSKKLSTGNDWSNNILIEHNIRARRDIELADLDQDGRLDIVVLFDDNSFKAQLDWYRNEGNGQFSEAILIQEFEDQSSGSRNLSIQVGDINNDGHPDIVAALDMANWNEDEVTWLENQDGLGMSWESHPIQTGQHHPRSVQVGHFNDDDLLDILVIANDQQLILHENENGITFTSTTVAISSVDLVMLTTGDLDADGDLDFVTSTESTKEIIGFENLDNQGTFSTEIQLSEGPNWVTSIEVLDLNDDEQQDIVFVAGFDGDVGFLENLNNDWSFSDSTLIFTQLGFTYESPLVITDLDSDEDLDIVCSGGGTQNHFMLLQTNGLEEFTAVPLNMGPSTLWANRHFANLNGDTHLDIFVAADPPLNLCWMPYNTQFGLYEQARPMDFPFSPGTQVSQITITDINLDGFEDLCFSIWPSDEKIHWALNDGQGNLTYQTPLEDPSVNDFNIQLSSGDLDNDGYEDLLLAIQGGPYEGLFWYRNENGTGFAPKETIYGAEGVRSFQLIDYNEDGWLDVLPRILNSNAIGWIKNEGGSFANYEVLVHPGAEVGEVVLEDVNQDGLKDLFYVRTSGFSGLRYRPATSLTDFGNEVTLNQGSNTENLEVWDFDLDGLKDILYVKNDEVVHWNRNIDGILDQFANAEVLDFDMENNVFFRQDLDSDGDKDIIYQFESAIYSRLSYFGNGQITAQAYYDLDQDGDRQAEEPLLNQVAFTLEPDVTQFFTGNDTSVFFFVPEGDYTLTADAPQPWELTTVDASLPIYLAPDSSLVQEFGYFPSELTASLKPDLTSAPTRCGFTVPFWLTCINDGTTLENGLVSLYVEQYATFLNATPAPDSVFNDTLYWSIETLVPNQSETIQLHFEIAGVEFLGDSVKIQTKTYLEENGIYSLSNEFLFVSEINCAYDPNDKLVDPVGYFDEHFTLMEDDFVYTIRFQNTGTDTAFNVYLDDYLDPDLDWNTFEFIAASHQVEVSLDMESGLLRFNFPNILLPDSTVNEPLSHGFAKYRIAPQEGLAENTPIENTADIFFDFNPPITTNTTLNTLVSAYPILLEASTEDPSCFGFSDGSIEISVEAIPPFQIEWSDPSLAGFVNDQLAAGTYVATITDGTGGTQTVTYTLEEPFELTASSTTYPQTQSTLGSAILSPSGGTPPYQVTWDTDPVQTGLTASDLEASSYTYTLTDQQGCTYQGTVQITSTVSVQEAPLNSVVRLFPNPAKERVYLQWRDRTQVPNGTLELMDLSGRVLLHLSLSSSGWIDSIDLTELPLSEQVYLLRLRLEENTYLEKLVITP